MGEGGSSGNDKDKIRIFPQARRINISRARRCVGGENAKDPQAGELR
jgi:hypothetical protein